MKGTDSEDEFSIVVIPDTQILSAKFPETFMKMTQWIVEQRSALNIQIVLHVGDVVAGGAVKEKQFEVGSEALGAIRRAGIPMLVAIGNHDYDDLLREKERSVEKFNQYFGMENYRAADWFGSTFEEGKTENSYAQLTVGGTPYLFVCLEFGPRDEVLAWADRLLRQFADHKAIIVTHCYMYVDGTRNKPGDRHNPKDYPGATGANDGEDQWHKSFKHHPNLVAVFSGHQVPENVSQRVDLGEHGNPVLQSFQNWQSAEGGGEGRVRIVTLRPDAREIRMRVFNPLSGQFETAPGYEATALLEAEE